MYKYKYSDKTYDIFENLFQSQMHIIHQSVRINYKKINKKLLFK